MCVIYTVRAYTVCENDFSFEGRCWYQRCGDTGTRLEGGRGPFCQTVEMYM